MLNFSIPLRPVAGPIAAVFGSGDPLPGSDPYRLAEQTGDALARAGYAVASGGYGGVMEGASKAAKAAGGETIGVTSSIWGSKPNAWVDHVLDTATYEERLLTLVQLADVYVVLPGATGTLVELAMVWERACKKFAAGNKPILCIGEFFRPLVDLMTAERPSAGDAIQLLASPAEIASVLRM
jgi:uncharacterized protein (TIGR00725 family)